LDMSTVCAYLCTSAYYVLPAPSFPLHMYLLGCLHIYLLGMFCICLVWMCMSYEI